MVTPILQETPGSARGHGERALWVAVVQQAIDDVADERIGSLDWDEAVAFFTHAGDWSAARASVADMLELHADDLARVGQRLIADRRISEGLEAATPLDLPHAARRVVTRHTGPLPRLEAVFVPKPPRAPYVREWRKNPAFRFDPCARLPSERPC
jgi:hypothetical protein